MTTIKEIRKHRVFGMAIFDWITSLLAAFIIGKYVFNLHTSVLFWIIFIISWIGFGVLVHWSLGIDTQFGYYLGINNKIS